MLFPTCFRRSLSSLSARLCRLPKQDEYWKQYLICSPLASKLQIAVNKDVIDIDNFSLQKWPPVAAKINRDEFLGISFSHYMEILHKTKDLHEILLDSNEIRQLRDVCIFEVNGIDVYM